MRRICLALLLLMFFVLPASALDFVTETVDEGSMQGELSSLIFDNEGNPHISFVGNNQYSLKYAWFDGTDWIVQTIDTSSDGDRFANATSIALDQEGNPHISYFIGCDYKDLRYAWFDGTEWYTETVDSEGEVGKHSSIAIDSNGNPHIGYHTMYDTYDLKYAKKISGIWNIETVVSGDTRCSHSSMVLDSNDNPHFSYKYGCSNSSNLYYIHFDGTDWSEAEQVDSSDYTGKYSSIALDENGTPHISYYDSSNYDLKYALLSGDEWETYTLDSDDYVGEYSSIQVDSDGYVHISYYDSSNGDLKYAFYDGIEWSFTTVDSEDRVGYYSSLALDASGNPAISYYDSTNYDLKYASFDGESWKVQAVPPSGLPTGSYPEIALDSDENPHMIYTAQNNYCGDDDDADSIFYAYHDGTEWQKQVIVSKDNDLDRTSITAQDFYGGGMNPSLEMDDNNVPHVTYIDGYNGEVKYGVLSGDSWDFETVAFGDNNSSMAVEGNGTPHISFVGSPYFEISGLDSSGSSDNLWHAVKSGDMWDIASVDQEGNFGMNAIAVDSDGLPHICYFKESSISNETFSANDNVYELKYAVLSGDNWVTQTVSSDIYVLYCDLAVDSYGTPHIAFVKPVEDLLVKKSMTTSGSKYEENYELFYATLVDGEWDTLLVDTLGYFRDGKISIQVDSYDNPHITYGSNGMMDMRKTDLEVEPAMDPELRYAYYDGSTWYKETLATGTMYGFGLQSSLALTSSNIPHIAYFTGTGVNYMTVPQEEAELIASSGDGCNLASFSPAMALLILPLLGLFRKKN